MQVYWWHSVSSNLVAIFRVYFRGVVCGWRRLTHCSLSMPWYRQSHWRILIALGLGLGYGVTAAYAGWGTFTADWVAPFGTIFFRLLLLVAVPLVLASLITGIASLSDLNKLSRIGGKTIVIYVSTTLVALAVGLTLVNLLNPGRVVPETVRLGLQRALGCPACCC